MTFWKHTSSQELKGFRRKKTTVTLCKSARSAIQLFNIHYRKYFAIILNSAVYLSSARVSMFHTLVPPTMDIMLSRRRQRSNHLGLKFFYCFRCLFYMSNKRDKIWSDMRSMHKLSKEHWDVFKTSNKSLLVACIFLISLISPKIRTTTKTIKPHYAFMSSQAPKLASCGRRKVLSESLLYTRVSL